MKAISLLAIMIVSYLLITESSCKVEEKGAQAMTYEEHPLDQPVEQTYKQVEPPQVMVAVQNTSLPGEGGSYGHMTGFQAGFIMPLLRIHNLISIRGEVNGSLQGANYTDYGMDGKMNLVYINIPIVARYKLSNGFFGEAGIQPGFCVSAKDNFNGNTSDYKDYISTFDFGIPFGIGYEFKKNFGIGFRVIAGLTNINSQETVKDHNMVMALRGTYNLNFKKKK